MDSLNVEQIETLFGFLFIIVIIYFAPKKEKKSGSWQTRGGQKKRNNTTCLSLSVNSPRPYSSILSDLESIVVLIARKKMCDTKVIVSVQKINNTYCRVRCGLLADTGFYGVNFGDGFSFIRNDYATFQTELATGFTTVEDIKREILLQFHWTYLSVSNTELSVFSHGEYINTPLIEYSFTVNNFDE